MDSNLINKNNQVFIYFAIIFILLTLSLVNIKNITSAKKSISKISVLGVETSDSLENKFWNRFLQQNPSYLPGLLENGQIEKVRQIDPSFRGL